ncbi:thiosulfate oxidation carrier protein SoxY [Hyphomicrobium sulfonivorans]|uniref:thiosulfate oxidation carrier protein SoxY n=1 Tax=Hyphomicrobium sulfonivorans TaxID=121290 RepID=UPI001570383B|nr:thiosulfate oxidation carrier protein SoxY [Hyphomicrobium sulfonivorans]MBI1650368.1 thiosulfate oxidation carrier protein SoxY [Hyphomicrobium sulfonivorans]NSL72269.1 thiosulfate oxidation carrier protein SoxY [Hyphomicrobium sulfonivorans]
MLDRRTFLLSASAAAATVALVESATAQNTQPLAAEYSAEFKSELAKVLQQATPLESGIVLDLPESVDNGEYVPITIDVASPMTPDDHVKSVYLLSTANPRAQVATFHFTPLSGKARVTSRMRLAQTQDVVVVAMLSGDRVLLTQRLVDVGVGGCGI